MFDFDCPTLRYPDIHQSTLTTLTAGQTSQPFSIGNTTPFITIKTVFLYHHIEAPHL
jgi:hypothetical protein